MPPLLPSPINTASAAANTPPNISSTGSIGVSNNNESASPTIASAIEPIPNATVNNAPPSAASGNIADISESATGTHVTVSATDAEGDTVTYSEVTSVLTDVAGLTLNSATGAISGDPTDVAAVTTYNFTLRATAGGKTADRAFNIIVQDTFTGGALSEVDIETAAAKILLAADGNVAAGTGGTLTINGTL